MWVNFRGNTEGKTRLWKVMTDCTLTLQTSDHQIVALAHWTVQFTSDYFLHIIHPPLSSRWNCWFNSTVIVTTTNLIFITSWLYRCSLVDSDSGLFVLWSSNQITLTANIIVHLLEGPGGLKADFLDPGNTCWLKHDWIKQNLSIKYKTGESVTKRKAMN